MSIFIKGIPDCYQLSRKPQVFSAKNSRTFWKNTCMGTTWLTCFQNGWASNSSAHNLNSFYQRLETNASISANPKNPRNINTSHFRANRIADWITATNLISNIASIFLEFRSKIRNRKLLSFQVMVQTLGPLAGPFSAILHHLVTETFKHYWITHIWKHLLKVDLSGMPYHMYMYMYVYIYIYIYIYTII